MHDGWICANAAHLMVSPNIATLFKYHLKLHFIHPVWSSTIVMHFVMDTLNWIGLDWTLNVMFMYAYLKSPNSIQNDHQPLIHI